MSSADWSAANMLVYGLVVAMAAAASIGAIWSVGPASRSGVITRAGVIGLHLGALVLVYYVTDIGVAIPPMLVVFASMVVAFARFTATPLPRSKNQRRA